MTLGTHVAFASVLYLGGATLFGYKLDWLGWLLAAAASLLPVAARLIEGEPLRVVVERVAMAGHTLRWLVSRINQGRPYYLLGEVEIPDGQGLALTGILDSVETYHPASYRGSILRLHYARAAELGPWLDLVAVQGEVVVQFWLKPGAAAVTLGAGEEPPGERIPDTAQAVSTNIADDSPPHRGT